MSKEFILTIGIVASLAVVFFIVVPVLAGVIENKKNPKKKRRLSVFEIIVYVILMAYSFILIFLVVWAFNASLKTSDRWDFDTYSLITDWQFSNFATAYKFVTASVPGTNIKANVFQCLMNGFLFSGGAAFSDRLKEAGGETVLVRTKGTMHGYDGAQNSRLLKELQQSRLEFLSKFEK